MDGHEERRKAAEKQFPTFARENPDAFECFLKEIEAYVSRMIAPMKLLESLPPGATADDLKRYWYQLDEPYHRYCSMAEEYETQNTK
jgi:hypothetical protein